MEQSIRAYLADIGRRGGRKSRRALDPETARAMVRVREARRAYRRFHAQCFWSFDPAYVVGPSDVAWVIEQLRKHGGREAWEAARKLLPLTDYQASLALLLSENRTFDSYLAGGAAILIEPNTTRFSRDLDYFHDSEVRVAEAFAADRTSLETAGYSVDVDLNQPGFIRAIVSQSGHATKVDWAHDSSWRFMPTVREDRVGFLLHPVDLAVNKVLALAGRDEPRDVVDALYLHRSVLGLGALCWAACGKDPGFTPLSLLELLRRRGKVRSEDLARLALAEPMDLQAMKREWLETLDSVEPFVAARSPEEIGCLYYSASQRAFVDPREVTDAVPHFGRPGGVVPRIPDS